MAPLWTLEVAPPPSDLSRSLRALLSARRKAGRSEQSGAVRGDQARSRAGGAVGSGAGQASWCASAGGQAGAGVGGAAGEAGAAGPADAGVGCVSRDHRRVVEGGPRGAAQAASHGAAGVAAAGGRVRRGRVRASGLQVCLQASARAWRGRRGVRAAVLGGGGGGRGRLGRGDGHVARCRDGRAPVRDARLPLGRRLRDGVRARDPAGVSGGPRRGAGMVRRRL